MNDIIIVTFEGEQYKFRRGEIINEGFTQGGYTIEGAAEILAANVERPTIRAEDGTVIIDPLSFNDSYWDMVAELCGDDGDDDEDGDDEDE